jgi:hypothetical protein
MKYIILFIPLIILAAAYPNFKGAATIQNQTDTLSPKPVIAYKPGMGDFMLGIQMHHSKLWFAGKAGNWQLAGFETREIQEGIEDIQQYCGDRHDLTAMDKFVPVLETIHVAINQKDTTLFKSTYTMLTNSCNSCHRSSHHEYIVIKTPEIPPFSNEVF